jgi:hypothetical protein
MSTPADFTQITEKEAYDEELFGFRNYALSQKSIVGISTKLTSSPHLDIYFGSYNGIDRIEKDRSFQQSFQALGFVNQLSEQQSLTDYSSKNKLDFKYDKDNLKARLDVNAVVFDNQLNRQNLQLGQNLNYQFGDRHQAANFYENLFIEWKASDKWGFHAKASHRYLSGTHQKSLEHNDPAYPLLSTNPSPDSTFRFRQPVNSQAQSVFAEAMAQYQSKLGDLKLGSRYQYRQLSLLRQGFMQPAEIQLPLSEFLGNNALLKTSQLAGFVGHQLRAGDWDFDNELQLSGVWYPVSGEQEQQNLLAYRLKMAYSPMGGGFSVAYNRNISSFPLEKLVPGFELLDFQTVRVPANQTLRPQPEYSIQVSGDKKMNKLNTQLSLGVLYGQIRNADQFLAPDNGLFFAIQNQLKSEYLLLSFPIETRLQSKPLVFTLEPEYVANRIENKLPDGTSYFTQTQRYLLGFKVNSRFEQAPVNFFIYPKLSSFIFQNDLFASTTRQNMWSLDMSLRISMLNKKLNFSPKLRSVLFSGDNIAATFTNVGFRIEAPTGKWYWFLAAENLLNDTVFIRRFIFPQYFNNEQNRVFGRYIQLGIEIKWK